MHSVRNSFTEVDRKSKIIVQYHDNCPGLTVGRVKGNNVNFRVYKFHDSFDVSNRIFYTC